MLPPGADPSPSSFLAERWRETLGAAVFLTRLPIRIAGTLPADALARSSWSFPLIGAGIGLAAAAAGAAARRLGLPDGAAAMLAIAAALLLTGALHEDGLADTADGFGGGATPAAKREIMRDSRIGTFGVLALLVAIGLKATALATLAALGTKAFAAALVAAHALSRAVLPAMLRLMPAARADGLGAGAGKPSAALVLVALGLAWAIGLAALGPGSGTLALGVTLAAGAAAGALAVRQIGGYTGDVLGAAQQLAETAVLLAAAAG